MVLIALVLVGSGGAYLGFRASIQEDAPGLLWAWDASWGVSLTLVALALSIFARLTIELSDRVLRLSFGWIQLIRIEIPLASIEAADPVTYRPIRDFGGWGIRNGKFRGDRTAVYSVSGSSGVLLTLREPIRAAFCRTRKILVGTPDHGRLCDGLHC